jgi:hypothetical protein
MRRHGTGLDWVDKTVTGNKTLSPNELMKMLLEEATPVGRRLYEKH